MVREWRVRLCPGPVSEEAVGLAHGETVLVLTRTHMILIRLAVRYATELEAIIMLAIKGIEIQVFNFIQFSA
jgi:hypothetical protein